MSSAEGFLGTWILAPQSCSYALGEPLREGRYTIQRDGPTDLRVTMEWVNEAGMHLTDATTLVPDGQIYAFEGPGVDGISLTLHSDHILETAAYRDSQRLMTVRRVLSRDLTTMTVVMSGRTPQDKLWENRAIYRRSAD